MLPAPLPATAGLVIVPKSVPSAPTLRNLSLSMQPSPTSKIQSPQTPAVHLPLGQRLLLLRTKGMSGQGKPVAQAGAVDSNPLKASFQTCAIRKPRDPRRATALNIHLPAVEIALPSPTMPEVCREILRPVALAASCLIPDATILSSSPHSREARVMLVPLLVSLLLTPTQRLSFSLKS